MRGSVVGEGKISRNPLRCLPGYGRAEPVAGQRPLESSDLDDVEIPAFLRKRADFAEYFL